MTANEKVRRRRRRALLVPLVGVGVAAWAVHRRLGERADLAEGWQALPPAPVSAPAPAAPVPAAEVVPAEVVPAEVPAAKATVGALPPALFTVPDAPAPAAAPATAPAASPVFRAAEKPADKLAGKRAEPVAARARAVPAATAVASVTVPAVPERSALPDRPYGPGSLRALTDGASPDPAYTVKGKSATKVFHAPGGAYYTRTRADVWFRTARDARGAGFTERTRRHD